MEKTVRFLFLLLTIIFTSCGQDRSGEYYALVKDRIWIEEKMREVYLWYEDIPGEKELKYLTDAQSFFKTLLTKTGVNKGADKYSELILLDESNPVLSTSYGMQCKLYQSSNNIKYYYALVLYVFPDSPAADAGIKRGDWIGKINNKEIDKGEEELLYTGGEVTLELSKIKINYKEDKAEGKEEDDEEQDEEDNDKEEEDKEVESYEWVALEEGEVPMSAAREIPQTPYIVNSTIDVPGIGRLGYLAYTNFDLKLDKENHYNDTYIEDMIGIFRKFKSDNIQEFVLDLRYNPGGYLVPGHVLASLLAPEEKLGELFCFVEYNDKLISQDQVLYLNTSITNGVNLNLKRLYVITSEETAAAAEVLINCLSPHMNIITIGATTVGQNVASKKYSNDEFPSFILSPIVAYIKDSNSEVKYEGIKSTFEAAEITFASDTIYNLGDPKERLLSAAISVIKNGKLPVTKEVDDKLKLTANSSKRLLNDMKGIILE